MRENGWVGWVMAVAVGATLLGCGTGADTDEPEATYTRTAIRVGEGGVEVVDVKQVTASEQRAQTELRRAMLGAGRPSPEGAEVGEAASAVVMDPDPFCLRSLWLFDDYEMTGNKLCLLDETPSGSTGYFQDYYRYLCGGTYCFTVDWEAAVRSYWAGEQPGVFDAYHAPWTSSFSAWQFVDFADPITRDAYKVTFFPPACAPPNATCDFDSDCCNGICEIDGLCN
jgi:hypothetical protein